MEKFIKELKELDLHLKVSGKDLLLTGKEGKLTPSEIDKVKQHPNIISFIKENKKDIMDFLKKDNFKLDRNNISSMYALSPVQEGILFHSSYLYSTGVKNNTTYHTQFDVGFSSAVDVEVFKKAWSFVINNHTILRTGFIYDKLNVPVQFVNKEVDLPLRFFDFTNFSKEEKEAKFKELKNEDRHKDFDFTTPPLMRITLVKLDQDSFKMIWTKHHVLWDGWSGQIIIQEVIKAYKDFLKGNQPDAIKEDRYEDFINYIKTIDSFKEKSFWQKYLKDFSEPTLLPFCSVSHERNKGKGTYKRRTIEFTKAFTQKISDFSKSLHITPNTLTQGVWAILVSKYSGSKDVVYGVTVSGRPADSDLDFGNKVGLYINTIPFRATIKQQDTVNEFLKRLQKTSVEAREFQHTSLNKIQDWNEIKGDCFDSLLSFTNYPVSESSKSDSQSLNIDAVDIKENNNYLLSIQPSLKEKLVVDFTFNSNILEEEYVKMICSHFETILCQIVKEEVDDISTIQFHTESEEIQLLHDFNATMVDYPKDKNIVDIFENQVEKTPNATALVLDGVTMTYKELNARANQLANFLRNQGVENESLVGICIDRSLEMIVGLLGILKSGGAYVPIDSDYPSDRIHYIVEDTSANIILVNDKSKSLIESKKDIKIINLEEQSVFTDCSAENLCLEIPLSNLAYVIYTSGTTGAPKGALLEHGNVVRLFFNEESLFDFNNKDVWCLFHSFCFDFSVWEIFGALLYGGKLVIVPSLVARDTKLFSDLLENEKVTVLNQTPSAFNILKDEVINSSTNLDVRYLIFGGEALRPSILESWHYAYPFCKLINMYGITETTVHVTYKEIGEKEIFLDVSDIGLPIPTMGCYILDENLQLLPIGVVGELYVSGAGLGRGYLNRPELTLERFITNPFNEEERLYKTGDLAKRLLSGAIEYLGRNDNQVKIRGYRIELGEIEAALNNCPYTSQSVLIVVEDASYNKELVGYVVVKDGFNKEDVIAYLSGNLPKYMIPSMLIQLDEMPLTSNGKVDKKALPDPGIVTDTAEGYVAPRTEKEEHLAKIWSEILNKEKIGVTDDFFEFGGHSLKLTRLITRYFKEFGVKLELKDLFINTTIESHSKLLFTTTETQFESIKPVENQSSYILSSAQHRMWALCQSEESNISYSMPSSARLEGEYDTKYLKQAILAVIDRHEILRTVFKSDKETSEVRQWVLDAGDLDFKVDEIDFREVENPEKEVKEYISKDAQIPFDLATGPLLRAALLQVSDTTYIFYYNLHHIISDGVSNDIIKRDVLAFYEAFKSENNPSLPEIKIQYKDYAAWQIGQLKTDAFAKHKEYWLHKLSGDIAVLDLPSQKIRPKIKTNNGATVWTFLPEEINNKLKSYCKENGGTMFMAVLAVWNILLFRYTNKKDILIGTPIAGRDHADLENQIGMYFNTLVLRNKINPEETFKETFSNIKESTLEDAAHQTYPFDLLIDNLNIKWDASRNPLYDVMLSYHNTGENVEEVELHKDQLDHIGVMKDTGAKLDLLVNFKEIGQYLYFDINFNTDLYDLGSMKVLMNDFKHLLTQLLDNQEEKIGIIDFQKEVKQSLRSLNVNKFKMVKK